MIADFFLGSRLQPRQADCLGKQRHLARLSVLVLSLSLASACSGYEVQEIAPKVPAALAHTETRAEITVGAEAIVDPGRQKALLGVDFSSAGFLPVLIAVENRRGDRVLVQRHKIQLVAAEESVGPARRLDVVDALKADGAGTNFGWGGGCYGPGCGALLLPFLAGVAVEASDAATRADIATDYARKEFRDSVLAPGDDVVGTLFFPAAELPGEASRLVVPVTEVDSGAVHDFRLELRVGGAGGNG